MTCKHQHGDEVPYLGWVCGQCYRKLDERPKRLEMVSLVPSEWDTGGTPPPKRQDVVWQAEIKVSDDKTTLSKFIKFCAKRFMRRGGLDIEAAYEAALEALRMMDEEFGDDSVDWSRSGAVDLADEEMQYWDCDTAVGNS